MLRLRTFGGLALEGAGGILTGRAVQPRRLALLTILATTNEGRGIARDTLHALLWPESDAESARHSLYQALHVLRHDLEADDLILGSAELRLNYDRIQADVLEFQAASASSSERLVELYGGPFLQGFYLREAPEFERWVESRRDEFARIWRDTLAGMARQAAAAEDHLKAAECWRRVAEAEPLDGHAALGLIRSLAAAGDRSAALRHAERHARALDQELGVLPDPALTTLCQQLRREPEPMPPSATLLTPRSIDQPVSVMPLVQPVRRWRSLFLAGSAVVAMGVVSGMTLHRGRSSELVTPISQTVDGVTERRLAVLPFTNLGPSADLYFVDGLRDEIASRLGTIHQIALVGRTSVNEYRAASKPLSIVAKELRVEYVLSGSVSWARSVDGSTKIRVIPQLVRASDGRQLWADHFETELADVFAVQGQIAERAAAALGVALGTPERQRLVAAPTNNLMAYDAYLHANVHEEERRIYVIEDRRAALAGYERAVELDPTFAGAFARLVSSHLRMYEMEDDRTPERARMAQVALQRAAALAPNAVETQLARADYELTINRRPDRALLALRAAEKEQPNNLEVLYGIAASLMEQGKLEAAASVYQRTIALDPRAITGPSELAHVMDWLHRWAEAVEYTEKAIALSPRNPGAYVNQAWTYLHWRGDTAAARHMLARGVDAAGRGMLAQDLARYGGVSSILIPLLDSGMVRVLDTLSRSVLALDPARFCLLKGQLFTLTRRPALARPYLDSASVLLRRELQRFPEDQVRRLHLAETYSALAWPDSIVPLAERILRSSATRDNLFLALDTWFALATAYVRTGQKEPALTAFAQFMRASHHPTAAWVRSDPVWNPLHQDPRFEKILEGAH